MPSRDRRPGSERGRAQRRECGSSRGSTESGRPEPREDGAAQPRHAGILTLFLDQFATGSGLAGVVAVLLLLRALMLLLGGDRARVTGRRPHDRRAGSQAGKHQRRTVAGHLRDSATEVDAPVCFTCRTKRTAGSCHVCEGCGATSGCS